MEYPVGNQIRERSAPLIVKYLDDVGIKVDLRQPKGCLTGIFEGLTKDNTDWDFS